MNPIKIALDIIRQFEGYHDKLPNGDVQAYPDPKLGWRLPTIGYGTTYYPDGTQVQKGDVITRERAEECLVFHVEEKCQYNLEKISNWGIMNYNQQAALYSFAYNLGEYFYDHPNFRTITRLIDSPEKWGNIPYVEYVFTLYRNPGSKFEGGLKRRRAMEAKLFCTPC